jgi:hypothetical protein
MTYDPTMRSKPHIERREREARRRRDTFEKIFMGEDGGDDIAKARDRHDVGARGLAAATSELALDLIRHHRRRLGLVAKGGGQPEESNMRHTESLASILKDSTPVSVCKAIVDRGRSPCGEHELVAALTKRASELRPELSPAQAFAELYKTESVWRACAIAKDMPFHVDVEPLVVGGADTRDLSDESEAIAQLKQLGARKWPSASEAQQFANAFTDPVNAALANRAHKRPAATTSFEWPR